ncbi:MAG: Panacea domain-containing protein [Methanoregula sp.]
MIEKTRQLIAYLIQNHPFPSITSLMKLSYIVDLVSVRKVDEQISDFEYIRFKYGPFDKRIYEYVHDLLDSGVIVEDSAITQAGEVVVYEFDEGANLSFSEITSEEKNIIDGILDTLGGYGPKALVDLTYKTKPMEKIGAKQNNEVGLNERLDLRAK